jgi:hypothetical protein
MRALGCEGAPPDQRAARSVLDFLERRRRERSMPPERREKTPQL